jgi:hypothetical protein
LRYPSKQPCDEPRRVIPTVLHHGAKVRKLFRRFTNPRISPPHVRANNSEAPKNTLMGVAFWFRFTASCADTSEFTPMLAHPMEEVWEVSLQVRLSQPYLLFEGAGCFDYSACPGRVASNLITRSGNQENLINRYALTPSVCKPFEDFGCTA